MTKKLDLRIQAMFVKRCLYYVYHPEELERTIAVVDRVTRHFHELMEDQDRFDYESPANGRDYDDAAFSTTAKRTWYRTSAERGQ